MSSLITIKHHGLPQNSRNNLTSSSSPVAFERPGGREIGRHTGGVTHQPTRGSHCLISPVWAAERPVSGRPSDRFRPRSGHGGCQTVCPKVAVPALRNGSEPTAHYLHLMDVAWFRRPTPIGAITALVRWSDRDALTLTGNQRSVLNPYQLGLVGWPAAIRYFDADAVMRENIHLRGAS